MEIIMGNRRSTRDPWKTAREKQGHKQDERLFWFVDRSPKTGRHCHDPLTACVNPQRTCPLMRLADLHPRPRLMTCP